MYDQLNMGKCFLFFSFCVWLWGMRKRGFRSLNIGIYILQNGIKEKIGKIICIYILSTYNYVSSQRG